MNRNKLKEEFFNREKLLSMLADVVSFIIGSSFFAVGLNMFSVSNGIACGGVTGLSTVINHLFPFLPIGAVSLALNIPLFILAFIFLGRKLFMKSFVATVILSVVIDVFAKFIPAGTDDKLLASLFYGVCTGVGLSFILMRNATSGGTDIIGKLINKKYPHLSLGRMVLLADIFVVITTGIVFKNIESALYSAIVVFVQGEVIDLIIYGTDHARALLIVTSMPDEVSKAIVTNMHRGVTILPAKGGYTNEEKGMLVCAVRAPQVNTIKKIVRSVDEHAFTMITHIDEILGEGFKSFEEEGEKS